MVKSLYLFGGTFTSSN